MKKYFYLIIAAILFVTALLVVRPKTPKNTVETSAPTPETAEISFQKMTTYKNSKYGYEFQCPSESGHQIEQSTGDGTVTPYFQETCYLESNQIRIYVHTISFYESMSKDPSAVITNYSENSLSGFKTIEFAVDKDAGYFEIFLTPSRVVSLRGYNQNYFNAIKATLKITSFPTPTPKLIPEIQLLDTTGWSEVICHNLSYKLPPEYDATCRQDDPASTNVLITRKNESFPAANIWVRRYDGGSRRQYWIDALGLTTKEITQYTRIQESKFGQNSGLDFFVDGGWYQGGYASPILINSGNTIIIIHGGRGYSVETKTITRSELTDTLASTVKIVDN